MEMHPFRFESAATVARRVFIYIYKIYRIFFQCRGRGSNNNNNNNNNIDRGSTDTISYISYIKSLL